MKDYTDKLTQQLIGPDDQLAFFAQVFPDALILDYNLQLKDVGYEFLNELGLYQIPENFLAKHFPESFHSFCRDALNQPYFLIKEILLNHQNGSSIRFRMNGFLSGLLTDHHNLLVIRFTNIDQISKIYERLDHQTVDIDRFIYQSSHSLRGPLATIKGLVNIIKLAKDKNEFDLIVNRMEHFAKIMDDKLCSILALADSGQLANVSQSQILAVDVFQLIKQTLRAKKRFNYSLRNEVDKRAVITCNSLLLNGIIENFSGFIDGLIYNQSSRAQFTIHLEHSCLILNAKLENVSMSETLQAFYKRDDFTYTNLLNRTELLSFYTLRKLATQANGSFDIVAADQFLFAFSIRIPIEQ